MVAAVIVGRCTCPVCASARASLRVSAKQLAYVVCNSCNAQVFARSDASDEKLRALHLPDEAPGHEPVKPAPAPAAKPKPAPAPAQAAAKPAPAPTPTPTPENKPASGLGWGMLA